jgi:hypothetical protein
MPRSLPPIQFTDPQDIQLAEYRDLTWQAILGLIFGLLSPVVLVDTSLWALAFIPLIGIFFSVWALRRIKRNPSGMTGRKRAILGLSLSLVCLFAAPTSLLSSQYLLNRYAKQLADTWLKLVMDNQLSQARCLMLASGHAKCGNGTTTDSCQSHAGDSLMHMPLVQVLHSLGSGARVRFYQPMEQIHTYETDQVSLAYAVTYDDAGERKSFFVCINVQKKNQLDDDKEGNTWRIASAIGGGRPKDWVK